MGRDLYMPDARYIAVLQRQRQRIAEGLPLRYFDDTTPGDKSTHCSWGLCSEDKEAWPDAEDHLWPDQFTQDGRVAPKYLKEHQQCPLDRRSEHESRSHGCFYTCRVFKPKKGELLTREDAIALYNNKLNAVAK